MRIIAGEYRHRKLLPPEGQTTRPITDRVKLALFNMLQGRFEGAMVADLFSGTGSLGLETLSRGAAYCWFAERDRDALDRLRQNIEALGCVDRVTIWTGDIEQSLSSWLAQLPGRLDMVFLDPPYALTEEWFIGDHRAGAASAIAQPLAEALAEEAVVVLRAARSLEVPDVFGPLALAGRRCYGTMALNFYGRREDVEPMDEAEPKSENQGQSNG